MLKRKDFQDDDLIVELGAHNPANRTTIKYEAVKKYINKIVKLKDSVNSKDTFKYVVGIDVWNKDKKESEQFHYFVIRHITGDDRLFDSGITINGGLDEFTIV